MAEITSTTGEQLLTIVEYFSHRPRDLCITCRNNLEARPGVLLCRSCLQVAGDVLQAIQAEEARAMIVHPGKEPHPR